MQSAVTVDADSPSQRRPGEQLDADALFVELVHRHRPLIHRLCRVLLGDASEAEDAAQQTFLLAYESLLSGVQPRQPRAWLFAIARRECWARRHRRGRERAVLQAARAELDPSERVVLRDELATVIAGLRRLPARQKQALVLRELVGLSYRQIATVLEIFESAADSLLVRARRSLRRGMFVLAPVPFSLSLLRSLQHFFRRACRTAHAWASVGAQATAGAAATLIPLAAAVAALAGAGTFIDRATQAAARAPARTALSRSPDSMAERRADRRRTLPQRHLRGVATASTSRQLPAGAMNFRPAAAAAGPSGLTIESSERSQAAVAIDASAAALPAPTLARQDEATGDGRRHRPEVAGAPEAPSATRPPPLTQPPAPPDSTSDQPPTEPATSASTADQTTNTTIPPPLPGQVEDTPSPPAQKESAAPAAPTLPDSASTDAAAQQADAPGEAAADDPAGSAEADARPHGAPGERGTVDGVTPGADPAPPPADRSNRGSPPRPLTRS